MIAAFYYLRIIKIMYFDKEEEKFDDISGLGAKLSLVSSTLIILFYFILPSFLINLSDIASKVFS